LIYIHSNRFYCFSIIFQNIYCSGDLHCVMCFLIRGLMSFRGKADFTGLYARGRDALRPLILPDNLICLLCV